MKPLVKITYKPWEEVVIHETIQYTLDNFITVQSTGIKTGGLAPPLLWAEGIIFRHSSMAITPEIIKEQLEGRIHWNSVRWALMPEFKTFIEIRETKVKIPILNVSANEILSEVAKWLRKSAKSVGV